MQLYHDCDRQVAEAFSLYAGKKMRMKHYARYMDDGIMVHESREYLKEVLAAMGKRAQELHLEFNEKTQILPISEGVDFLGFRFYLTDTGKVIRRLRTSNKRRWKRRLKKYREGYRVGKKSFEEITRSVASYRGHLSHGHTWKLQKKVMGSFVLTHAPKKEEEDDR